MSRYVKTIAAVLGGVATWGITAASNGAIDLAEWFGLLGALGTALGVYAFPNTNPDGPADPNVSETDGPKD